jgi:Calcineurin-like phosphoesterase/Secretion system C-terminal sorting domain
MKKLTLFFIILCFGNQNKMFSQTTLVSSGSSWKYLDNGTNQGTTWRATSFNDTSWSQGNSELGYGDGDEATVVSFGPNSFDKYTTTYFRKTVAIANASLFPNYTLKVKRDDGVAVYVNGIEVYRNNLVVDAVNSTFADPAAADDGSAFLTTTLPSGTFISGNNSIAVEIHQADASSSDISFDLELIGNDGSRLKHICWGSSKNPLDGLTITWRNSAVNDLIKWGYTPSYEQGSFPGIARPGYSDTFFNYTFPIVNPNVPIYYQLFDSQLNIWTPQKIYTTAPPINTSVFSFVAIGDSRGGDNIWQIISELAKTKQPDFTIFNGDIVADATITSQWDEWFDYGKNFLETNLIFHALGNHDASSVPNYLNNFELPKSVPITGTELYYSIDYGDAVFISLNSENPSNTAQYNWLISTLQANVTKKWKIVFFHKPFYTIGPHVGEMDNYYNTWWKAFDDYGVDLILNGHDHMYERTKPLNRNISVTTPVLNYGSQPTEGRCEIVCGGAGAGLYTPNPTWFIENYKRSYNLCKFDVTSTSLCGTVFDENNLIIDSFCINKPSLEVTSQNQVFYPLKVVPNPVTNIFRIEYSSPIKGAVTITIFDLNGKLVESKSAIKSDSVFNFEYDGSKLESAVYSLEIEMGVQKDHSLMIKK